MGFSVTPLAQKARTATLIADSDLNLGNYDLIATDVKGDTAEFSEFVGGVGNFTSGLVSGGFDVSGILHAESTLQVGGNIVLEGGINNVNIDDEGDITTAGDITASNGFKGVLNINTVGDDDDNIKVIYYYADGAPASTSTTETHRVISIPSTNTVIKRFNTSIINYTVATTDFALPYTFTLSNNIPNVTCSTTIVITNNVTGTTETITYDLSGGQTGTYTFNRILNNDYTLDITLRGHGNVKGTFPNIKGYKYVV